MYRGSSIKMNPLPFYQVLSELIKPTPLNELGHYSRHTSNQFLRLSDLQKDEILKSRQVVHSIEDDAPITQYSTQVQLRFSLKYTPQIQDGLLPAELIVLVNDETVYSPPPTYPRKRPTAHAIDITKNVIHSLTNLITIKWFAEPEYSFLFSVNLVRKRTAQELFSKLMTNPVTPTHSTQKLINELTSKEDQDLCVPTSLRVSLTCPLGKSRMSSPCRGVNCKHLQCFDANSFLKMNEKKSSFICPVCNLKLDLSELCIDGYFMDVIRNWPTEQSGNDVELFPDGSWHPVCGETPTQTSKKKAPIDMIIETVTLDDGEDEDNDIFIINQVNDPSFRLFASGVEKCSSRRSSLFEEMNQVSNPSPAFESSFRLFALGVQGSSSRRNSTCEETINMNEPEVIDILD